jgi:uncharacterized membrane protein required for colicin V production
MSVFDLIIFSVLAALAFRGWMTGMIAQIVSVGSLVVSWIVASRFAFLIAPSIPAEEPWNKIGAMIVLFIITLFAVRLTHRYLEKKIKDWNLAKWNRHLGGLLGFIKGLILCMVLTFFGVMLSETTREVVFKSKSGHYLVRLIESTEAFIPPDSCELLRRQLEHFNAQINGDTTDGDTGDTINGTETSAGLSPEEKSLQKMRELIPSDQEIQDVRAKTQSNLENLFSQGSSFLEQAQNIRQGTEKAASLLDALGKWWTGSDKKEENNDVKTTGTDQTLNPLNNTDTVTNPITNTIANTIANTTVLPPVASLPKPVAVSPDSEEKLLFRRRFSQNNPPAPEPLTASTPTTVLPELSDWALPDSGDEPSDNMTAIPIPISRSSALFRLRSSGVGSSDRLLNSSPTRVPATLFAPPKH